MASNSWYKSFAELSKSEREGFSYTRSIKKRGSEVAVIAPHGGGIEPGTSEIALAVAGWRFSYYTFDGVKPEGNELLHLTSTRFDEPKCLQLLKSTHTALSVHGCAGDEAVIYAGGLNKDLKERLIQALLGANFAARTADIQLSASDPQNICNQCQSGQGVQLEISDGLRRSLFEGLKKQDRKITTPLFRHLVSIIQNTLIAYARDMDQDHKRIFHFF